MSVGMRETGAALLVAILAAGCGSTASSTTAVPESPGGSTAPGGTGGAPDNLGGTTGSGGGVTGGDAGSSGASGSGAPGSGGSGSSGTTLGTTGGPGPATFGPGINRTTIQIGVIYTANTGSFNAGFGAKGGTSDGTEEPRAVINEINARGGVAGRKLVPVFHAYDATSTQTRSSQDQAACDDFTQDHHVFAVVGAGYNDLDPCLARAGVMRFGGWPADKQYLAQFPYLFDAGTMSQDRAWSGVLGSIQRLRYFTPWDTGKAAPGSAPVKVGVLCIDQPTYVRPLQHLVLPALARLGHPVASSDVIRVPLPTSQADTGRTVQQIQAAVLRFRSDRVTHVVLMDAGGTFMLLFGKPAASQGYYPRYAIGSESAAQVAYSSGTISAKILSGAVGMGWNPMADLPPAAGNRFATPATKACLTVMQKRAGQTFPNDQAAALALRFCDEIQLLVAGIAGSGPSITRTTVRSALERLGSAFSAAGVPRTLFGPDRHDGNQLGFDQKWDGACPCIRYVSRGFPVP